jgi:multicomponent Na+:H+ antiporter subunit C
MSWALAALVGTMGTVGTYFVVHRSLTRIILGIGLLANAVNLVALAAGTEPADPPITGRGGDLGDPIPQALVLTAIVIGLGVTAFLLATALRSWTIDASDDVEDDIEDRRLARAGLEAEPDTGPDPTVDDSEFSAAQPPGTVAGHPGEGRRPGGGRPGDGGRQ